MGSGSRNSREGILVPSQAESAPGSAAPLPTSAQQIVRFVGTLIIVSAAVLFTSELMNQHGVRGLWLWLAERPHEATLNFAVWFSIASFWTFLTNRLDGGCQLVILMLVLPVVSLLKQTWLREPLVPSDVPLGMRMLGVLPHFVAPTLALLVASAILTGLLLVGWLIRCLRPHRFALAPRFAGCCVGILLPLWLMLSPAPAIASRGTSSFSTHAETELTLSYRDHGFALEFLKSAAKESELPDLPADREAQLERIVKDAKAATPAARPAASPDIVVILSESFWDPTDLPHATFSPDPAPNYHALRRETGDLRFLSPTFGGRTANVEFELLTGLTMAFLPSSSIPYEREIDAVPVPSVAHLFLARGYHTLALHTYTRKFWRRDQVYPLLGFEEFHGEEAFPMAPTRGMFLADAALGDRMVDELEKGADRPLFMFAISMENHGPYRPGRYAPCDISLTAPLNPLNRAILQSYAQGVRDADAMLGNLVSYLRTRPRPTIVIFFGDHLPAFSQDSDLYQDLGYVGDGQTARDRLRLHTTPALIWANYPLPLHMQERVISPNLIWPELLRAMGIEHPFYTTFLDQVRIASPGFSRTVCADASGNGMLETPLGVKQVLDDYHLLEYDLLQRREADRSALFTLDEMRVPAQR